MKQIVRWAVFNMHGEFVTTHRYESEAIAHIGKLEGTAVKLTGEMTERVKKTVWVNMFKTENMITAIGTYNTQAEAATKGRITHAAYLGAHPITVEVDG